MLSLYTYFRSSAAYRVRIALELKQLAYRPLPVHLLRGGGEQHSAAFAAINPAELVPVLCDGELTVTQSLAIIEYLDEAYPGTPLLPADAAGRARVRSIALAVACDIHPLNNLRVLQHLESEWEASADDKKRWYVHWLAQGFQALEASLQASPLTGRYCHGDTPTLADCCLVPQVANAARYAMSLAPYPTLARINTACLQLDAFQRARPEAQADAQ